MIKGSQMCLTLIGEGAEQPQEERDDGPLAAEVAAAEAAHLRGKKIRAHVASKRGILECAKAGFDIIDQADRMDAECIDAILEAGSFVVPSMMFPLRYLGVMESIDLDEIRPLMPGMPRIESIPDLKRRVRGIREDFEYTRSILPEAHAAGVKMLMGDDYGTRLLQQGEYAAELEFYVNDLGFDPLAVIRWGTRNGAEAMNAGAARRFCDGENATLPRRRGAPAPRRRRPPTTMRAPMGSSGK